MKLKPFADMRRRTAVGPGRDGFTLVELLVVMTIIGLLAGLLVAGAMKFKDAQVEATTDAQLTRLQLKLSTDYKDVLQKCHKEQPPDLILQYCGDPDRARAVHTAATLRVNFPETFSEATTPFFVGSYAYQPKKTFASVAGAGPVPTTEPQKSQRQQQERAALLFLILTERATGGGGGDDTGSAGERRTAAIGGKELTYFIDLYGQPIVYERWAQTLPAGTSLGELDVAPYARASVGGNKDPLDPKNLVAGWSDAAKLNVLRDKSSDSVPKLLFNASNRVPTVISAGRNKTFDSSIGTGAPGGQYSGDDRVGFRLERSGAKGDKGDQTQ